jgi:hypothetical protein
LFVVEGEFVDASGGHASAHLAFDERVDGEPRSFRTVDQQL